MYYERKNLPDNAAAAAAVHFLAEQSNSSMSRAKLYGSIIQVESRIVSLCWSVFGSVPGMIIPESCCCCSLTFPLWLLLLLLSSSYPFDDLFRDQQQQTKRYHHWIVGEGGGGEEKSLVDSIYFPPYTPLQQCSRLLRALQTEQQKWRKEGSSY